MHYEHFKQRDPKVLKALIESFPFATITASTPQGLMVAHAPLTVTHGAVEFHLARKNPITVFLQNGAPLSITVNGPSAPVSPSWYKARFEGPAPDRSKTAPTYNYISANLSGALHALEEADLTNQISALVAANEPDDGWKMHEIDPAIFSKWRELIAGFRMTIETFEITAKLSQEQNAADKPGIIAGLQKRGTASDIAMAHLLEIFDGTPDSLIAALYSVSGKSPA